MSASQWWVIWPGQPGLSAVLWLVIAMVLLYIARTPAHQAIATLGRLIYSGMRVAARSVMLAEARLRQRNREVLLAGGVEAAERGIEREFERVEETARRNLETYPSLHQKLNDLVQRVDEDYHKTSQTPPSPPGWAKVVESIAKMDAGKDPAVAEILEDIHKTLESAQHNALGEYRKSTQERHRILRRLLPHWRRIGNLLGRLERRIEALMDRSRSIDRHMAEFEQVQAQTDYAQRNLSSSSLTQFFISALVLAIAVGGAVINFQLIARPMQEMVGGASRIMGFPTSEIAALVIIFVEITMGLFLMELLRITRLFPVIRTLDDNMRRRMVWACFSILLILASVESALAYMRDYLAAEQAALTRSLLDSEQNVYTLHWIPTTAQMVMGFILPFALTFVAIPLETFVHSSRTVLGVIGVFLLRVTAFVLRLIGNIGRHSATLLIHLYDVVIFAPLWVERQFFRKGSAETEPGRKEPPAPQAVGVVDPPEDEVKAERSRV